MTTKTVEQTWDDYIAKQPRPKRKYRRVEPGKAPARGPKNPLDAKLYELKHRRMGGINCEVDRLWLQGVGTKVHLRATLAKDFHYAKRILDRARMRGMTVRAWIDTDLRTVVEWVEELPRTDDRPIRFGIPAPRETIHVPKDTFTASEVHLNGPCLLWAEVAFWKARLPKARARVLVRVGSTEDTLTLTRTD